ncbi:hypothetical protein [Enterovibrio norvegicus]|uniref:hypothetical protein n=1 Tax=Enterovibrio norvegicus TaxID=188144 RepID=UPI000C838303|nr:hypothetical protein [Enterovibrio norvegicus]PMH64506.1 hypothetical protein BCU62_15745 [Enterovibrio norvegicus]
MKTININLGTGHETKFGFMFDYEQCKKVLIMRDETGNDPYTSLTNACPVIVPLLVKKETQSGEPAPDKVIYIDSEGDWTEVIYTDNTFVGYQALRGATKSTTPREALSLVVSDKIH